MTEQKECSCWIGRGDDGGWAPDRMTCAVHGNSVAASPPKEADPRLIALLARLRKVADLGEKHPPFSYEQGVCVGHTLCADELEAVLSVLQREQE